MGTNMEPAVSGAFGLASGAMAVTGAMALISTLITLAWAVLNIIGRWRVYTKAGERGWSALIPFYTDYSAFKAAGMSLAAWGIWLAVWLGACVLYGCGMTMAVQAGAAGAGTPTVAVTLVGLSLMCGIAACVMLLIREFRLSRAFGRGVGMWLLLVLLSPIGNMVLGFDDAEHQLGGGDC